MGPPVGRRPGPGGAPAGATARVRLSFVWPKVSSARRARARGG
ncbi:hypothetical protein ACFSM7_10285 [Clavibacter michiganensis subsp. tessellarius]